MEILSNRVTKESATMHKLLVPVDGSDNAMRALEYAIRLAKEYAPMELVIVYAHEPPIIWASLPFTCRKRRPRNCSESMVRTF